MRFFHLGIHTSDNVHLQPCCHCSIDKILTYCITAWDWNSVTSIAHTVATGHIKSSRLILPDCGRASVLHRNKSLKPLCHGNSNQFHLSFFIKVSVTTKIGSRHFPETQSSTPEWPTVAKQNSLLIGRHLEVDHVHTGITLLLVKKEKEDRKWQGGRTETTTVTFCILYI